MRYREYRPSPPLSRAVECLWTLEVDRADVQVEPQRIVPDGCVEWIVHVGAPPRALEESGTWRVQPQRFFVGPRLAPVVLESAPMRCLGIRFHPAGARAVVRAPLRELAGSVVASDALATALDREIAARLDPDAAPDEWVRTVDALLCGARAEENDPLAERAAAEILRTHGRVPIDALAGRLGVHRRALERSFERHVGLSPKQLARIARFQQVFRCTREPSAAWSAVAVRCGYFDQAHLIRDFRELAGETPAALFEQDLELLSTFTRRDRAPDPLSQSSNRGTARAG